MPALKHNMDDNPISPGADAQSFWILAKKLSLMTERERISSIRSGFAVTWLLAAKTAFDLDESAIASFADISVKTLRQRLKKATLLGSPASERFDRLAQLALLSETVFEARGAAEDWIVTPNDSLGGEAPFFLCRTELGGRQAYSDLLPSGLTVFSLVMFITAEDDEHEEAIFRRADHQHSEGSRSRPGG